MKPLLIAAFLVLLSVGQQARAAADFTDFEGTYQGSFKLTQGSNVFSGTVKAIVSPSQNGKAMTMEIFGSVQVPPAGRLAMYSKLKFKANRTIVSSAAAVGYINMTKASSKYSGQKNKFSFKLSDNVLFNASFPYVLRFTKKRMILTCKTVVSGQALTIKFNGGKKQ